MQTDIETSLLCRLSVHVCVCVCLSARTYVRTTALQPVRTQARLSDCLCVCMYVCLSGRLSVRHTSLCWHASAPTYLLFGTLTNNSQTERSFYGSNNLFQRRAVTFILNHRPHDWPGSLLHWYLTFFQQRKISACRSTTTCTVTAWASYVSQ